MFQSSTCTSILLLPLKIFAYRFHKCYKAKMWGINQACFYCCYRADKITHLHFYPSLEVSFLLFLWSSPITTQLTFFSLFFMPLFLHGVRESVNTFRRNKLNVSKFNFSLLWNSSCSHFGLWEKMLLPDKEWLLT